MPKVSVIVPVYNAEQYLNECVNSILNQTITDLELVLVDDGSTDSSPILCDEWTKRDERVRVIHKENGRAASARNAGAHAATGEYIAFVDADDWVAPEMYETMLAENVDVCLCDYIREYPQTKNCFTQPNIRDGSYNKTQIQKEIYPHLVMDGLEFPITISNWALLIRRSLLTKYHLLYREDILVCEDAPFGSEVLYQADSFSYLKGNYFYHYRILENSVCRSYKSWWWDSFLKINEEIEAFFSGCQDYDFTQQIKANMFYFVQVEMARILEDTTLSRKEQNRRLRLAMGNPRVVRMMKNFDVSNAPISLQLVYWAVRFRSVVLRRLVRVLSKIRHRS